MEPLTFLKIVWRMQELKKHDRRPLEETLAVRATALSRLIQFAQAGSPFYAAFHQGYEGAALTELPILTKAAMMEHFDELLTDRGIRLGDVERHLEQLTLQPLFRGRYRVCSTSGSTGRRGFFVFDRDEWATAIASFWRAGSWCGHGYPLLFAPLAVVASTVPWHMTTQAGSSLHLPWVRMEKLDAAEPLATLTQRLNGLRPRLVTTYPSVGRALAKEQLEGRLNIAPLLIFAGSEVMTPAVRALMERVWGRGCVFDHYGATETGSIAAECSRHRLHLAEDLLVVEGVDRQNRPVPPGIASEKVLVTVLFQRTQPLIRYEISDRIVFAQDACDCGLPWRVLERVEGRDEEMLRLPAAGGGTREVHPIVFEGILDNLPIAGWQVTSDGNDVAVLLAGAEGISTDSIREKILAELAQRGMATDSVTVRKVDALVRTVTGKASHVRVVRGSTRRRCGN